MKSSNHNQPCWQKGFERSRYTIPPFIVTLGGGDDHGQLFLRPFVNVPPRVIEKTLDYCTERTEKYSHQKKKEEKIFYLNLFSRRQLVPQHGFLNILPEPVRSEIVTHTVSSLNF